MTLIKKCIERIHIQNKTIYKNERNAYEMFYLAEILINKFQSLFYEIKNFAMFQSF